MHAHACIHIHLCAKAASLLIVFYSSLVSSHPASFIYSVSLFSFGTRINPIPVYEAAVVSQIEVDSKLLDRKTDGQRRDGQQKQAD